MSSTNNTAAAVPSPTASGPRVNPNLAISIVVLIGACLAVAIFSMYIRRCTQGIAVGETRRGQSLHFYDRPGEGLERAVVDSLPMVSFSVVKTQKHEREDLECTVCLESFEEDELLRLLPKCSHVFHAECIDVWFLSHSTCPLCRTNLKATVAGNDGGGGGVPAVGEVSQRILEAQEDPFSSSARMGSDNGTVIGEDEVLDDGSGQDINGESERNSARLALLRKRYQNSNSFQRAVRGVEIRERLATLSARYPSASSTNRVQEAPQGCIHLSLQRTTSRESTNDSYNDGYGSLRYGTSSLGRLESLNEREMADANDQIVEEEGNSSSWIAEDHELPPKTLDTQGLLEKPRSFTGMRVLLGKPRSGKWEQRERGSLRGLRKPFSRSTSEGRAHVFEIEDVALESGNTLAQRTMQWLSGGNSQTRSGPLEGRSDLHQIVTE